MEETVYVIEDDDGDDEDVKASTCDPVSMPPYAKVREDHQEAIRDAICEG